MTVFEENLLNSARYYLEQIRRYAASRMEFGLLAECVMASDRLTTLVQLSYGDAHGLSDVTVDMLFDLDREAREILNNLRRS